MKKIFLIPLLLLSFATLAQNTESQIKTFIDAVRTGPVSQAEIANAMDQLNYNKQGLKEAFTATGTNTYSVTVGAGVTSLSSGVILHITFTNANSSTTVTLNVNSIGAVAIKDNEGNDPAVGDIKAGSTLILKHNGTNFRIVGAASGGSSSGGSVNTLEPNIQSGSTYTVQATDTTKLIYSRRTTTPQTITLPSGLKVGSTFVFVQDSTQAPTFVGGAGVDIVDTKTATVFHQRETNKFIKIGGSSSGSSTFEDLTDGPGAYTGNGLNFFRVNTGETGLEYRTPTQVRSDISAQASDADLTTIAGLTPSNDDFLQFKSSAWSNRTLAQVRTDLALVAASITNGVTTSAPDQNQVFDALALKADLASPTFTGTVTIPANAYGSGWNGSNKPATEDGVYDKIESLAGIDYSRSAVTNSAGTVTMNWNSLALKNFDLTTTETGNITLSFTNTSNLVQGRLTLRVTGTITVTMPSGVVMDIFEVDIGRWNDSTNVLTLTGITASPFILDFYSDGTNIWCHASNRGL